MCLFRRKKKQVDELAEYENKTPVNHYIYDQEEGTYDSRSIEDACFITPGDVFMIRDLVVVAGVALKPISVGDDIKIGLKTYRVNGIEMFRKLTQTLNPGENGALAFKADKDLKAYILELIRNESVHNEPYNFDGKPTNMYTFFYKK